MFQMGTDNNEKTNKQMQKDTDNLNEMQSKTYEKEMWPQRDTKSKIKKRNNIQIEGFLKCSENNLYYKNKSKM